MYFVSVRVYVDRVVATTIGREKYLAHDLLLNKKPRTFIRGFP
jgi:hypothetical protein